MAKKPSFSVRKPSAAAEAFVRGDLHVAQTPKAVETPTPIRKVASRAKPKAPPKPSGRGIVTRSDGRELRRMTIYLPRDLGKRLTMHAAEHDTDISALATEAIEQLLR